MADISTILSSAVVFLFAIGDSGQTPIGTAFIVGYPDPNNAERVVPLVVTAKHVIADNSRVFARFSTQEGKPTATVEYDIADLRASGDYWQHPDRGVDIAVFRTLHFQQTTYQPVPMDFVASEADFREASIQPTDRVVMPGLLVNFMGLSRNYPIIRSGSIAMIPDEAVPMKYVVGRDTIRTQQRVLFIDGTAIQGESGSPVFLWPGPRIQGNSFTIGGSKPLLLGVLHGFYPALPRSVETVETGTVQVFRENSNVALAFPSWRLREILLLPELTARMQVIFKSDQQ